MRTFHFHQILQWHREGDLQRKLQLPAVWNALAELKSNDPHRDHNYKDNKQFCIESNVNVDCR